MPLRITVQTYKFESFQMRYYMTYGHGVRVRSQNILSVEDVLTNQARGSCELFFVKLEL